MRMLCICAKGEPPGYLTIAGNPLDVPGIARAVGLPETEADTLVAELDRWGVFSRDAKRRIYSRRLVKDEQRANVLRKNGVNGGRPPNNQDPNQNESKPLASSLWLIEFEEWWKWVPHKVGRGAAEKAFVKARELTSLESLISGVRAYAANKPKEQAYCHPTTWLNQRRWEDVPAGARVSDDERFRRMMQHKRDTGLWPWKTPESEIPESIRAEFQN